METLDTLRVDDCEDREFDLLFFKVRVGQLRGWHIVYKMLNILLISRRYLLNYSLKKD